MEAEQHTSFGKLLDAPTSTSTRLTVKQGVDELHDSGESGFNALSVHPSDTQGGDPTSQSSTGGSDDPFQLSFGHLRSRLEQPFDEAIRQASQTFSDLKTHRTTARSLLDEIFSICEDLLHQARQDRASIDDVRRERDEVHRTMGGLDERIRSFRLQVEENEKLINELRQQNQFLDDRMEKVRREQSAVDKRMTAAVEEKERLVAERDSANAEAVRWRDAANQANEEKVKAMLAQADAETALEEAAAEVDKLTEELARARDGTNHLSVYPWQQLAATGVDGIPGLGQEDFQLTPIQEPVTVPSHRGRSDHERAPAPKQGSPDEIRSPPLDENRPPARSLVPSPLVPGHDVAELTTAEKSGSAEAASTQIDPTEIVSALREVDGVHPDLSKLPIPASEVPQTTTAAADRQIPNELQ